MIERRTARRAESVEDAGAAGPKKANIILMRRLFYNSYAGSEASVRRQLFSGTGRYGLSFRQDGLI